VNREVGQARRRHLLASLSALALAALVAGCARQEPIKVGYVGGLTGRHYDLGVSGRNGVQLAVAELNAAGGIGGRPLELLVRDDGQDPEQARRAVSELAAAGVVAIVGPMTSAMALASQPVAEQAGVLMVSPTAGAAALRGKDDAFVTLFPSSAEMARALVAHLAARTAVRRVVVLADQSNLAFSASWAEAFTAELTRRGGRVLRTIPFMAGEGTSFAILAGAALEDGPDAVLVVANALDSAGLCQQLRKRSATVRLLGTDWGFTRDVLTHGGAAVEGALFTQMVDAEDGSARFTAFRSAYQARFGRPVDFAATVAYEAVEVLAEGLRRDPHREGIKAAVLSVGTFRGLQHDFTIDRLGDAQRRPRVLTVRGGALVAPE
jgi:branched-chain amino acid transport system substrate-binding protein